MSKFPRILAITGVALGGVLAVNAIAGARGLPNLFSAAKAMAEVAPKKDAKSTQLALAKPADAAAVAAAPAPMPAPCATTPEDLAKLAGLSPGELLIFNSLKDREADLKAREAQGDVGAQLMDAAGKKVDAKIASLQALQGQIQDMLKQVQAQQDAETAKLITTYSAMKPKNAAAIMAALSDEVRLPIAAGMKESKLSPILAAMTPAQAKDLTEKLNQRFADQAKAGAAALAGAPSTPAASSPAQAANTPAKPAAPAAAPAAAPKTAAAPAPAKAA